MWRRGSRYVRSRVRLVASRLVMGLAALVILVGVLRGGTRFFYCPMTQLAFDEPACSRGDDETGANDDAPALRVADCCQEKWRATVPAASLPDVQALGVAPAAVVAVLPPPPRGMDLVSSRMPFTIAGRVRAGPPPPRASERRAELMVFLN